LAVLNLNYSSGLVIDIEEVKNGNIKPAGTS